MKFYFHNKSALISLSQVGNVMGNNHTVEHQLNLLFTVVKVTIFQEGCWEL